MRKESWKACFLRSYLSEYKSGESLQYNEISQIGENRHNRCLEFCGLFLEIFLGENLFYSDPCLSQKARF